MYAELYGRNTKFGMAVLGVFTMSFHPPATSPRSVRARARAAEGARILARAPARRQGSPLRMRSEHA